MAAWRCVTSGSRQAEQTNEAKGPLARPQAVTQGWQAPFESSRLCVAVLVLRRPFSDAEWVATPGVLNLACGFVMT